MNASNSQDKTCQATCENCPASYFCARLKTALAVLESYAESGYSTTKEIDTYYKTLCELEKKGWDYPLNESRCKFADARKEVRKLTDRLIKVI